MEAILDFRMGDGPGSSELRYRSRQRVQRPQVPRVPDPGTATPPMGPVRPSFHQPRLSRAEPLSRPPALAGGTSSGSPGRPQATVHGRRAAHGRIRPRAELHSAPMEKKEIVQ